MSKMSILSDQRAQRVAGVILSVAVPMLMVAIIMRYDSNNHAMIWVILQFVGLVVGALCIPFVVYHRWMSHIQRFVQRDQ